MYAKVFSDHESNVGRVYGVSAQFRIMACSLGITATHRLFSLVGTAC